MKLLYLRSSFVQWFLASLVILGACSLAPAHAAVVLPIEVIGPGQSTETIEVNVASSGSVTGLWMQIHGLTLPNKASVQVNDRPWVDLNNNSVAVEQPGRAYGGIGGGFSTVKMTLKLAPGVVKQGKNILRFRLNDVSRSSIGFRVLRFNFIAREAKVLPETTFVDDDPQLWQPPINTPVAIAEGKNLWYAAELFVRGQSIKAKCTDCHAHDGRDLKYFNYSNKSIIERSRFHGLSRSAGEKIASYVRSLTVPYAEKGRPWNPPYQPGPGLDDLPVTEWAAGAGLEWVLDRDAQTFDYIFPDGITSEAIDFKSTLNAREIPVAIQYPDWNHWLPEVHPKDAWGVAFTNHDFNRRYDEIRRLMAGDRLAAAKALRTFGDTWYQDAFRFFGRGGKATVPMPETPLPIEFQIEYNASMHWRLTKYWEIITEFQMQNMGTEVLGASANDRTWYDAMPFNTAPHILKLEQKKNPINDGSVNNWTYFSAAWYQVQITLNNSNRRPYGTSPIDWPYLHAFAGGLAFPGVGSAGILTLDLVTAAQSLENGGGPKAWGTGWDPMQRANVYLMVPESHMPHVWRQVPSPIRRQIVEAYLKNWIEKTTSYPIADYYLSNEPKMNGVFASPTELINTKAINAMGGRWIERYWPLAANCRRHGVSEDLINQVIDFGKKLWPLNNWESLRATGSPPFKVPRPTSLRVVQRD